MDPVDAGADANTNIFVAAGDGDLLRVQALVASGVSVDAQDENGYSPLCVRGGAPRAAGVLCMGRG
jgi:hypothetical protein